MGMTKLEMTNDKRMTKSEDRNTSSSHRVASLFGLYYLFVIRHSSFVIFVR
jgi:hypothetical protein